MLKQTLTISKLQAPYMTMSRSFQRFLSGALFSGVLVSAFLGLSGIAFAQATDEAASEAQATSEKVIAEEVTAEEATAEQAEQSAGMEHSQQDMGADTLPADAVITGVVNEDHTEVYEAFLARFPGVPVEAFSTAPFDGLFEVITEGRIIYVDAAMTTLFQGEIIDLETGTNMTESRLSGIHMGLINAMGEDNMLVYKAKEDTGRSITVFTDINCGYCRLLHSEIDTLLNAGVSVRYLMFPRAGLDTDSSMALESVWCDDDPQGAMTSAKAGEPIQQNECETPIEQHYALAGQVGLRGTPLIYLDDGTVIPGYREAKVLVEMINTSNPLE